MSFFCLISLSMTGSSCIHGVANGIVLFFSMAEQYSIIVFHYVCLSWLKAQHSENEDHGIWSHHFMGNRWGNSGNSVRLLLFWAPKSLQMVIAAMKLKDAYNLEEKL